MKPLTIEGRTGTANAIISNQLNPLIERLHGIIADRGYPGLIDIIERPDSSTSQWLGSGINVIPSDRNAQCCPLLVAFSSGSTRGRMRYAKTLAAIRTHLIDCAPPTPRSGHATQVVVMFCDSWDTALFDDEFFDDFARFHARGVEFVFVLAGSARAPSLLSEVHVSFT